MNPKLLEAMKLLLLFFLGGALLVAGTRAAEYLLPPSPAKAVYVCVEIAGKEPKCSYKTDGPQK